MNRLHTLPPQDDICTCGKRIGDHKDFELWQCLQREVNFARSFLRQIEYERMVKY